MSDNPNPDPKPEGDGSNEPEKTFTQAEVNAIVKKKAEELYRRRVGDVDIDDLKAKASEKATAEERIAALESEIKASRLEAAVSRVVAEFQLSEKQAAALKYAPSEEAAREIAEGLAAEASARKKQGNHVPREGNNPQPTDDPMREFARGLFARATSE